MKAVIVECSNGAAVALCDDGSFRKLRNRGYSIGQKLLLKQKASANRIMQKLSICASLALVLLSFAGIGSYSYVSPYSFVSLDINPSIEYALNRYDKVISVSGINDEGQQVVSSIESEVKNQNITTALGVTIRQLEKDHYIAAQGYNHVIVSVCSANDTKAKSIASRVDTFSVEETFACSIDTMTVSKKIKDDADSLGITPGKLALIHAVAETTADADFNVAEWTNKTVGELESTIQQAASQSPDAVTRPMAVTVINSEYLSSILDDNMVQKADTSASAVEADTEKGSTFTDQQTNTSDSIAAGSDTEQMEGSPDSKPDHTDSTTASDDSAAHNGNTGSADNLNDNSNSNSNSNGNTNGDSNNNAKDAGTNPAGSSTAADNNSSMNNSAADNSSSTAKVSDDNSSAGLSDKGTSASGSGSENGADNALIEDSSGKKDSCPFPGTEIMEDSSNVNTIEEPADVDNSAVNGEAQQIQDVSEPLETSEGTKEPEPSDFMKELFDELPGQPLETNASDGMESTVTIDQPAG